MTLCESCRRDALRLYKIEIIVNLLTCNDNSVCLAKPIKRVITNLCSRCYLMIVENPDTLQGEIELLDCDTIQDTE